jgi:SAM-dependent methyltransferase
MIRSTEFTQIIDFDIGTVEAVHQARKILFQQHLPPAQIIVDLGGAAHNHPEGALLFLGYPHQPREIHIVDLPPVDRLGGTQQAEQTQDIITSDGVQIRYLYSSMSELSSFEDNSIDMVISGESIEHVSEADADIVCQEVYRILQVGGHFCLDTPNAALTRLQSPDKLIHPEHQKEYYVRELVAKLERWGFEIVELKGITPMVESLRRNIFDYGEMIRNIRLCDNPEEGYLFFIKACKPEH